ncbi:heat shock transcription factor, Y-linked-like [Phasianus colchicus]|uniref:HSF-type DNA-binding domain-containing protein n=1 Tax=Phasianus colchicus TaxID=9054 RepID=A0A669QU77_PHACC|nr:heat shock transcription factor, Y-linked-like [Phasianus colchicus]
MDEKNVQTYPCQEEIKYIPHASYEESTRSSTTISAASTFPEKLWVLAESHQFKSIWWGQNGRCIVIDQEMFQIEVLGKKGSLRVFGTESMKSFIRQLNVYGFTKMQRDSKRSPSLPEFLAEEEAFVAHRKLLCYYNPNFRKDHPELLELCKRRVAQKRRAVAAPSPQEDLNEGPPRNNADVQPMEGLTAGPEKSLLTANPQAGTQTVPSMGPPPPKQFKKAPIQDQTGSAPTPPDPAAAPEREECQPLAPSPLPLSSSPISDAIPPDYNTLPFKAPTFTPGSVWQAFAQPPQESELQDPGAALHYLSQCFAMAMLAAAKMTSANWGPWAVSHCPTCTCSSHKAAPHCPTCTCGSDRADAEEQPAP